MDPLKEDYRGMVGYSYRERSSIMTDLRAWTKREGERREEESRAHWGANVQRRGFFRGRGNCVTE